AACGERNDAAPPAPPPAAPAPSETADTGENETAALNAWFEEQWEKNLARSPMRQTFLGRKTDYDKWDDVSPEFEEESFRLQMEALEEMKSGFDFDALDPTAQLSWRLAEYNAEEAEKG